MPIWFYVTYWLPDLTDKVYWGNAQPYQNWDKVPSGKGADTSYNSREAMTQAKAYRFLHLSWPPANNMNFLWRI